MATAYTTIRDYIETHLNSLTKIEEVIDNPALQFDKYPVATITPVEGEADFETNTEDLRKYAFDINLYYETKHSGTSKAINALFDTVEDILDRFTQQKTFQGVGAIPAISMPANKQVMSVYPVSAGWGEVPDKDMIFGRIVINVSVSCLYNY